jgi:hypothetical protein
VGKVCDLCRGLETGISVVLMVKSNLGILFDYGYFVYIYVDGLMMMTILMVSSTLLSKEVHFGVSTWII